MADREPPPLFDDDDQEEVPINDKSEDTQDTKTAPAEEEDDDLFAGGGTEVSLDDDPLKEAEPAEAPPTKSEAPPTKSEAPPTKSEAPPTKLETPKSESPKEDAPAELETQPTSPAATAPDVSETVTPKSVAKSRVTDEHDEVEEKKDAPPEEEEEEEEETDTFDMEITITEPFKKGEGMSAYMAYKVSTKTSNPVFKKPEMSVFRRFSDFLGLHQKLVNSHTVKGYIVPPAPEKSVVGMTKVKMSKGQEEPNSMDFVEKRRAAMERYLNRTAAHPQLQKDQNFIEFLEKDELPKATSTSALSGAGVKRAFSGIMDSAKKMASKVHESDQWFEEKHQQIESLDSQLKKLHLSVESMVSHRRELGGATAIFAKSAAMLGNSEEHTALSRAISQLAETEEKIDQIHVEQANTDFYVLAELLKDYIGLIGSVRDAFREREKTFGIWQSAQTMLAKKRDQEAKLKISGKPDKLAQIQEEIKEWEAKEAKGQKDFEKISKTIRKEYNRFEVNRMRDFRSVIIKYLEALMTHQQEVIQSWEGFLPEAKAIA
ncbi:sorting nexin-2-like [Patiria miniata]|uniref:Sorting nexin-2 n=1 Tax=Patiria miniata TaxID=46514 RepID=A0A914B693_PATMI|nr:sorting nexin-2-like [Patiria miniata]